MPNTPLTVDLHEKIECAHTIESKFYNDPAILATEKAKIFRRTWQLAGTLNQPCGPVTSEVPGEKRHTANHFRPRDLLHSRHCG